MSNEQLDLNINILKRVLPGGLYYSMYPGQGTNNPYITMKFAYFVVCSVIVHVVLFGSIFDIYFTSPLVLGVNSYGLDESFKPAANRLVLFVADGLRADSFYKPEENGRFNAPYLRDVMSNKGTWGVSHTHIPTESRPGHVALIAGFYEDVSAIMRGWKENPVEFDSVFNKSKETWSWGSPDILPMFAKGSSHSHVHINCYHGDTESFAGDDSSKLDTWVFDAVQDFFSNARTNVTLRAQLMETKIVFFLHLLGIDSNGHSHHPASKEYIANIGLVDAGIKKTVELLDNFYENDEKTAYVFTADHGMTNWGSHGAGHLSETLTPLVTWGAGVHSPKTDDSRNIHRSKNFTESEVEMTRSWSLSPENRFDVDQADVAALMSALLGLPYPLNSVGSLPVNYLSYDAKDRATLARLNARQIAEQFIVKKREVKKHASNIFFRPYKDLLSSDVERRDVEIGSLIVNGEYASAILRSKELLELSLKGLRYYHTYDRVFLYFSVLLSFIGWIMVTVLLGVKKIHVVCSQAKKLIPAGNTSIRVLVPLTFATIAVLISATLLMLRTPWTYYVYCLLPVPVWYSVVTDWYVIKSIWYMIKGHGSLSKSISMYVAAGMIAIWIMIGSFFHRWLLTFGLLFLSFLPKFQKHSDDSRVSTLWTVTCWILAVFPLFPVVGRDPDMRLVLLGGLSATCLCFAIFLQGRSNENRISLPFVSQFFLPIFATSVVYITSKQSLLYGTVSVLLHVISWLLLALSWTAPLTSSTRLKDRLVSLYAWQLSAYMLLSLSYDAVFSVVLCGLMHIWIHCEYNTVKGDEKDKRHYATLNELDFSHSHLKIGDESALVRQPHLSDVRRSITLIFFLVVTFFGVGNIASVNSFDVRVVLPFVTVFNPFIMGGLLAYKIHLPYLMVTSSFCGVALATRTPLQTLCCIVMVISDVMAIHFVFMIQDYGSWLDIGTSISHFVIVMAMITSLLIFFVIANFLTTFVLCKRSDYSTSR